MVEDYRIQLTHIQAGIAFFVDYRVEFQFLGYFFFLKFMQHGLKMGFVLYNFLFEGSNSFCN